MSTLLRTNFTGGELSPILEGQVDLKKLYNACITLENFAVKTHGPAMFRPGMRYIASTKDSSKRSLLIPFQYNSTQTYMLEFGEAGGSGYMRVFYNSAPVFKSGAVYEIASPYTADKFDGIYFVQSKDVLIMCHPSVAPQKLSRTAVDSWSFATITFAPETPTPASITGVVTNPGATATTDCTYSAAAIDEKGEGLVVTSATVARPLVVDTTHFVTLTIARVTGAISYVVYRNDGNVDGYIGRVAQPASGDAVFVNNTSTAPDLSMSPLPAKNPFSGAGDYPSVVTLFQNRTVWANTTNNPNRIWLSRTGAYFDMRVHTLTDPLDDDSIEIQVASPRMDAITGIVPRKQLYVQTSGGVFVCGGGSSASDPITPANAKASPEGTVGAAASMPLMVGNAALFIQESGKRLHEMAYVFQTDSFNTPDMTIFSEHIGQASRFTQLAYAQVPDSIVYAARENGELAPFTYERLQDVLAWQRYVTDGEVESVAVIHDATTRRDQLWMCVKRTVNGATKRFIEMLEDEFRADTLADAFFLDAGLTYDGRNTTSTKTLKISGAYTEGATATLTAAGFSPFSAPSVGNIYSLQDPAQSVYDVTAKRYRVQITGYTSPTVVTGTLLDAVDAVCQNIVTPIWAALTSSVAGVDHLIGNSVTVVADGNVQPVQTVPAGGTVTCAQPAAVIHAGLPYAGKIKTTRMEGGNPAGGTQQGKMQSISEVVVRFYKTVGGRVGTETDGRETTDPVFNDPQGRLLGGPPKLMSGDHVVKAPGRWGRDGYVIIRQDQPLPMCVLLITIKGRVVE